MRTVRVKDEAGRTMVTIEVMRSGRYVGLDVRDKGVEHVGVAVAFSVQELDEFMALLTEVRAEVIEQNR